MTLAVKIGAIALKNPLICGAGEHMMDEIGLRRAIEAGASAVVMKSINESKAARDQLLRSDYALFDSNWRRLPWNRNPPADAHLYCRSGLSQLDFNEWLDLAVGMDKFAKSKDAYVVASLIPSDLGKAVDFARRIERAGVRVLEVNIGAPHGEEGKAGAIMVERDQERVEQITRQFRDAVDIPLWIKLAGQSNAIDRLADAARRGGADSVTIMGRFMAFVPDVDTMAPALGTRAAIGGPWALPLTCHWIAKTRERAGPRYPLIATNGARNGLDIARFLLAGASAVQMTSAIFTSGFNVIGESLIELSEYLREHGVSADEIVGKAADRIEQYGDQPLRPDHWKQFVPGNAKGPST